MAKRSCPVLPIALAEGDVLPQEGDDLSPAAKVLVFDRNEWEARKVCDRVVALAWADCRSLLLHDKRDRLFWAYVEDQQSAFHVVESVADEASFCYIGRTGHPGMRCFGKEATLVSEMTTGGPLHQDCFHTVLNQHVFLRKVITAGCRSRLIGTTMQQTTVGCFGN